MTKVIALEPKNSYSIRRLNLQLFNISTVQYLKYFNVDPFFLNPQPKSKFPVISQSREYPVGGLNFFFGKWVGYWISVT